MIESMRMLCLGLCLLGIDFANNAKHCASICKKNRSMVEQLKVDENIGGVVCCNEQYELDALAEIARKRVCWQ